MLSRDSVKTFHCVHEPNVQNQILSDVDMMKLQHHQSDLKRAKTLQNWTPGSRWRATKRTGGNCRVTDESTGAERRRSLRRQVRKIYWVLRPEHFKVENQIWTESSSSSSGLNKDETDVQSSLWVSNRCSELKRAGRMLKLDQTQTENRNWSFNVRFLCDFYKRTSVRAFFFDFCWWRSESRCEKGHVFIVLIIFITTRLQQTGSGQINKSQEETQRIVQSFTAVSE